MRTNSVFRAENKDFTLPMIASFLVRKDRGKSVAHALDFDLVTVGDTDESAIAKLRVSVKAYIEHGIKNGWEDHIHHSAPQEFWDKITSESKMSSVEAITVDHHRLIVAQSSASDEARYAFGAA